MNQYIKYLKGKGYSKSALEAYSLSLKGFLDYLNRNSINLAEITNEKLVNYKNSLKNKQSPQTVNVKLAAMKNFIEFLNQCKGFNIEYHNVKAIKTKNKKDIKNIGGIEKFLFHIEKNAKDEKTKQRNKLIIKILYHTGAKTNEVTKIKLKDIQDNSIRTKEKHIHLPKKLSTEIKNYCSLIGVANNDYIFYNFSRAFKNKRKTPLTEKAVEGIFNESKMFINDELTIRDLRNSFILEKKTEIPDIHYPSLWQEVNINTDYLNYIKK